MSLSTPKADVTGRRAILMLLLAAFLWGSGNVANKTILDSIDPWTAVFLRSLVAALFLLPFALAESRKAGKSGWAASSLFPSALFAIALLVQQIGYETASVTAASFLANAGCVLTPLLAFLILREAPDRATTGAALLMFLGAAAMSGVFLGLGGVNTGDMLVLLAAVFYALWALALGRHAMRYGRAVSTTLVHCLCAAVLMLPVALAGPHPAAENLRDALPEVLYLGIFSTALAFLLMVAAQARVSASTATILTAAESLFGAAGGILLLGERPGPNVVIGALLMLAAIFMIARAPLPAISRPPQAA